MGASGRADAAGGATPRSGEGAPDAEVVATAPCRVDLAGGTLDIWPLGLLHGGARTVNVALSLGVRVALSRRSRGWEVRQGGDRVAAPTVAALAEAPAAALPAALLEATGAPPLDIEIVSDSPRGAGLGASSSVAVALLVALERLEGAVPSDRQGKALLARDVEARLMSLPTGLQDHLAALHGGVLEIVHEPGGERVRRLPVDRDALARSLVVAYSGQSHFSAGENWRVVRARLDGEAESVELFGGIAEVAGEVATALRQGDLERTGRLVGREWSLRRRLSDGVSTPRLEEQLAAGLAAGAWGGKACGAGGGGCLALLAPPGRREEVVAAMERVGARALPATVVAEGASVR